MIRSSTKDSITVKKDSITPSQKRKEDQYYSKEISDSLEVSNQSFYDSLRARSQDSWSEMLVNAIVVPGHKRSEKEDFIVSSSIFNRYKGKRISSIHIRQVDAFTGNVDDTTMIIDEPQIFSVLNSLHYQTRKGVIEKNLLFEIGDIITAYTLSDNERILRKLPFIEDARIYAEISKKDTNDVKVTVVTRDVYSLGFSATVNSLDDGKATAFDRNFFGLGWALQGTYIYQGNKNPTNGIELDFKADNIRGSFISGLFRYRHTAGEEGGRIEFNRAFLTPETKYAGGLYLEQLHTKATVQLEDSTKIIPVTRNLEDLWIGRQFKISDDHARRNLILAGRFMRREYTFRPEVNAETNEPFHTLMMALGSIMFTRARYFESNMILGFGQTEDVPVGYRLKFTAGPRWSEFSTKYYSGVLISGAKIFDPLGYFLARLEFGNLYNTNNNAIEERIFKAHILQFSPLLRLGRFRLRNFIRSNYITGLELWNNLAIHFTPESGIRGLPNLNINGKQRFNIGIDMIAFAPWNYYGFKFAFYGFADIGFLGPSNSGIDSRHAFSGFGLGFRIRNESLVFKTLQVRFAYYPKVPHGSGHYTYDISTRDPQVFENFTSARPEIIEFR